MLGKRQNYGDSKRINSGGWLCRGEISKWNADSEPGCKPWAPGDCSVSVWFHPRLKMYRAGDNGDNREAMRVEAGGIRQTAHFSLNFVVNLKSLKK